MILNMGAHPGRTCDQECHVMENGDNMGDDGPNNTSSNNGSIISGIKVTFDSKLLKLILLDGFLRNQRWKILDIKATFSLLVNIVKQGKHKILEFEFEFRVKEFSNCFIHNVK